MHAQIFAMWQVFKLKCSLLMATPRRLLEMDNRAAEVKKRLEKCWSLDLDWNLYPNKLRKVSYILCSAHLYTIIILHRDVKS